MWLRTVAIDLDVDMGIIYIWVDINMTANSKTVCVYLSNGFTNFDTSLSISSKSSRIS